MLHSRTPHRTPSTVVAVLSVLLTLTACSSTAATGVGSNPLHSHVSLMVNNGTCTGGTCSAVDVLAFPKNQPHTPGGMWSIDLGTVSTATACLTLPASAQFVVAGPTTADTLTWTLDDALALGSIPVGGSRLQATPSTGEFQPAVAAGWVATLPGSDLTADSACAP